MRFNRTRLPFTNLINRNRFISLFVYSALDLFFRIARLMVQPRTYQSGNIVVILLHRLGDTVFTLPAVKEIYKNYGNKVILLCYPESIPIYEREFSNMKFCPVMYEEFYFGQRIAKRSVKSRLKNLKPEIIFDLTGSMVSASLIFHNRARQIVGTNRNQFRSIYNYFVSVREEPRLLDIYLDAISPLIKVPDQTELNNPKNLFNTTGKILIHPFAGWKEKEWSVKKFVILAEMLSKDYDVSLIAQENQLKHDVINEIKNIGIEVVKTSTVGELIKSIEECSLFIGNDSGPVNIANFLGKPTISIYGSTNPDYTASKAEYQIFIQKVINCSARKNEKYCTIGAAMYNCPGVECMSSLTVDEVYTRVNALANIIFE
jgi:heptosyltransferase II